MSFGSGGSRSCCSGARLASELELLDVERACPARIGAHAAQNVTQAHLAVLRRRVERHSHRVEQPVRRLLQHQRRLLKKQPEWAAAAARGLLSDERNSDASVHRPLDESSYAPTLVEEDAFGEVEQQHRVALWCVWRVGGGGVERVVRLADSDHIVRSGPRL